MVVSLVLHLGEMRGFSKATFAGLSGRNSKDTSWFFTPKKSPPQKKKERLKENPFELHPKEGRHAGKSSAWKVGMFCPM